MRYKRMIHDDNRIVLVNAIQNPGLKEKIMKIFTELKKKGKTIIIVTHDPGVAKMADRIINIEDGKII